MIGFVRSLPTSGKGIERFTKWTHLFSKQLTRELCRFIVGFSDRWWFVKLSGPLTTWCVPGEQSHILWPGYVRKSPRSWTSIPQLTYPASSLSHSGRNRRNVAHTFPIQCEIFNNNTRMKSSVKIQTAYGDEVRAIQLNQHLKTSFPLKV